MASQGATAAVKAINPAFNPRTVHFWAPVLKWGLVIAGISDFYRPVQDLSVNQNAALTATGMIWTRWCLIIKPRNIPLAAVNFFLGVVGATQLTRIALYRRELKKQQAESPILSQLPPKA
ncbi:mitochondrial pyruvate carrier [Tricharina praecox]|uniref:mitochondrial pyruvate carrier n=1 Tax=Tricharina praecox TaxID=43433 RepID=UPI002220E8CF|nr:mitochondrial pyruvate carrier [Tricharina praecox]KAI5846083.1 mitochondrial pyruvate carrier [Tricharina praecox]